MKKSILFLFVLTSLNLTAQNSLIGDWHIINTYKQSSLFGQPNSTFGISFFHTGSTYNYALNMCNNIEIKTCDNPSNANLFIVPPTPGQIPLLVESISNGLNTFQCGNTEVNKATQVCLKMFGGNEVQNTSMSIWVLNFDAANQTCTLSAVIGSTTYTIDLSKNSVANVEDPNSDNGILTLPNPFSNELEISSNVELYDNFQLFNSIGQEVYTGKLEGGATTINLSFLSSGYYLLQIGENKTPIKLVKE